MKIRAIELTNFRKFIGTVRVENIGDSVNVLVGRNELGKSTLLEAINAVIFEKAKSGAAHVKAYRHFVNGTVPEVKLTFEVSDKTWTVHKRFAQQAGKTTLTCSDKRLFEDDAAEVELQRILGFTAGSRGGEHGIWGTLWVQQGQSFGDAGLSDQAQRTMQGCLEAQIGVVTGGTRGQKIPKAIREALEALRNSRGPRGRYKDAIERLAACRENIQELDMKRDAVQHYVQDLADARHQLKKVTDEWDDDARRMELEETRASGLAAATRAAEIQAAEEAVQLAETRSTQAQQLSDNRTEAVAELGPLEDELLGLNRDNDLAAKAKGEAKDKVDAGAEKLQNLRVAANKNAENTRRLERLRSIGPLVKEISLQQAAIDRADHLEADIQELFRQIGANLVTDDAVTRIEDALAQLAVANAAVNAVAATVSFAFPASGFKNVAIDGQVLDHAAKTISTISKMKIAIKDLGEIEVDPQIRDRSTLVEQATAAQIELEDALKEVDVSDLAAARLEAARRREDVGRSKLLSKQLAELTPGIPSKKIPAGLEPLKVYVSELQGRLKAEMDKHRISDAPDEDALSSDIASNHTEAERLAHEIGIAESELAGPQSTLETADEKLQLLARRLATLVGTIESKKASLQLGRAAASDAQLAENAETLEREAEKKRQQLSEKNKSSGDSVEAIAARIKRLEGALSNHHQSLSKTNNEITRLRTLVEANEGGGVEESLLVAEAEQGRIENAVREFERETEILQLLLDTLETAEGEAKARYLAPVIQRVEPYLKMLLPGADIVLDEELRISAIKRAGQAEEFSVLSGGTREQLAILARLAFAELLLGQGKPATVILDDALAFSDDDRIESMFDILMRAGGNVQIIVLTCRRRLFSRLGAAPIEIRESAESL